MNDMTTNLATGQLYHAKENDIGICIQCGTKLIINKQGDLALLTKDIEAQLKPTKRRQIKELWTLWAEMKGVRGS